MIANEKRANISNEKKLNFVDSNEKKKMGKKGGGGLRFLAVCTREGGGHSDAYFVKQGGWGGLKIWGKCVCN